VACLQEGQKSHKRRLSSASCLLPSAFSKQQAAKTLILSLGKVFEEGRRQKKKG
jgi:hypothetical protein